MADGTTITSMSRARRQCIDANAELCYWREHRHAPPLDEIALSDELFVAGVKFAYDGYLLFGRVDIEEAIRALEERHATGPLRRCCSWFAIEHICRAVWARMCEPEDARIPAQWVAALGRAARRRRRRADHAKVGSR